MVVVVVVVVVVAKLLILGISFLTSFILELRIALLPKLVTSDILSSIFLILYTSFFAKPFFAKLNFVHFTFQTT